MASLALDTLQFARKLTAAGVPLQQAEAQAEAMGEAFGFYVDNLVTRDYLDARLDARFVEQDARIEQRFTEQDARIDQRFTAQHQRISELKAMMELHHTGMQGDLKLVQWMLALVVASTVIPALNGLFGWV